MPGDVRMELGENTALLSTEPLGAAEGGDRRRGDTSIACHLWGGEGGAESF